MSKQFVKWGLAAALFTVTFGVGTSKSASAATLSFSAQVFSLDARSGAAPVSSYGGFPVGAGFFGLEEHEALAVNYQTNGLPYYVSNVSYTANSITKFVATGPAGGAVFPSQPTTQPAFNGFNTSSAPDPPNPAIITPGSNVFGNKISQDFGVGVFNQGINSAEYTYVRIDNAAGEMKGTVSGNSLFDFGGAGAVPGSTVTVTFSLLPGFSGFPATLVSSAQFSITNNPGDPATGNFGSTGGNVQVAGVPEPGSLAMLLGLGVSGSALVLFRRRK